MYSIIVKRLVQNLNEIMFLTTKQNSLQTIRNSSSTLNVNPKLDLEVNRIIWIDMEMTGLEIETDKIMEIACLVTDADLNVVAEGPDIIIHHPKTILDEMNSWCKKQHKKTGLTQACLESTVGLKDAENEILKFIQEHTSEKMSPLAGNSVYMDRLFLLKYMPRINDYLHYRIIDVSTVKELCRRWNPKIFNNAQKKNFTHRALSDIKESVEELKFYKKTFFKSNLE